MRWCARVFFLIVAALSIAGVVGATACTRQGHPTILPPTPTPATTIYVDARSGNDTTGNGTTAKPFKSLTRALVFVKNSQVPNLTVQLAAGTYNAANGEKFPIVIPVAVSIVGSSYGAGPSNNRGTFIDGLGEDLNYEHLVGKPSSKLQFVALEVPQSVSGAVSLSELYVGSSHLSSIGGARFVAVDALGSLSAEHVSFAAGTYLGAPHVSGVIVPSGTLSCNACTIRGSDDALIALTLPSGNVPTVSLNGQPSQSTIAGKTGIATDATASVAASNQVFASSEYGYRDAFPPLTPSLAVGPVDFGQGVLFSIGGNVFIGQHTVAEIAVTVGGVTVSALGNTWNPLTQGTNQQGQYAYARTFGSPTTGRNVTIAGSASGSTVLVGPAPPPTPSPSPSPSTSPSPSPT